MNIINHKKINDAIKESSPFTHLIIDDFFTEMHADQLSKYFPEYDSNIWTGSYNDQLVVKKTCQDWSRFPSIYYQTFSALVAPEFVEQIKTITGIDNIIADYGLHGGGLHIHSKGGKLEVHVDYHTHYKLPELKRNLNLLVYLNKTWEQSYGGCLELWDHDPGNNRPKSCVKKIEPRFNRAVIFDTTQNSWHGMPEPYNCPEGGSRQSIAIYYLSPNDYKSNRNRALFAPKKEQENNPEIFKLIQDRARNY